MIREFTGNNSLELTMFLPTTPRMDSPVGKKKHKDNSIHYTYDYYFGSFQSDFLGYLVLECVSYIYPLQVFQMLFLLSL